MIGFNSTSEVSENYYDPFPKPPFITIRANTTTELDHYMDLTYVDGVGNATVSAYGSTDHWMDFMTYVVGNVTVSVYSRPGADVEFGNRRRLFETYIFPTNQTEMNIQLRIFNDFIAEFNEFFRLNITLTTTDQSSPATCQAGDAEQYRCSTDIFILDDDCESWHTLCG